MYWRIFSSLLILLQDGVLGKSELFQINILDTSYNQPRVFSSIFFKVIKTLTVPFASQIGQYVSKCYHKTAKHNSENCIRETLTNTGTLILKTSQKFAFDGEVNFNTLAKSDDCNAGGVFISALKFSI